MTDIQYSINPWKWGFFLIFGANIVFHCSSFYLLLAILFLIFGYFYIFISAFFRNYANDYSEEVSYRVESFYEGLLVDYKSIDRLINNLSLVGLFFSRAVALWSSNMLTFRCGENRNNKNYMLVFLGEYLNEEEAALLQGFLTLEYEDDLQRVKFFDYLFSGN